MKYQTISLKQFYPAKGTIYYVAIATVIFSHGKITWYFDVWRYHVFGRKLTWYFIGVYIIIVCILSTSVTNNNLLSSQNEMSMLHFFSHNFWLDSFINYPVIRCHMKHHIVFVHVCFTLSLFSIPWKRFFWRLWHNAIWLDNQCRSFRCGYQNVTSHQQATE